MRNFAKRLITYESRTNKSPETKAPQGFAEMEKLRRHLTTYVGHTAFHTLLARSLALSAPDVPGLRGVRVNVDDPLTGLEELQDTLAADKIFEGRVMLLARLLELLMVFIGAGLTLRLVSEVWPKIPLDDLDFSESGKNKKAKNYVKT